MIASVPSPRYRKGTLTALATAAVFVPSGYTAYQLPPEPARYTLEATTDGVETVWEHTSSKPAKSDAPEHQPCPGDVSLTTRRPAAPSRSSSCATTSVWPWTTRPRPGPPTRSRSPATTGSASAPCPR